MKLIELSISQKDCEEITNFVYQEKKNWKKDLNNVKALSSGFYPDYDFMHDIGDFCCKNVLPKETNYPHWHKSCWWVNLYEKGHYWKNIVLTFTQNFHLIKLRKDKDFVYFLNHL